MYTYRIVLDAYDSARNVPGAIVVTYSRGYNRDEALRRIGPVRISSAGAVSDGLTPWPGTRNMPMGNVTPERYLPEWRALSMRSVKSAGTARILSDGA